MLVVLGLWLALRVGPAPAIRLETEWPAVGRSNLVIARFSETGRGLGVIRLELTQGERTEVVAEQRFERRLGLPLLGGGTAEAVLAATVGTEALPWLPRATWCCGRSRSGRPLPEVTGSGRGRADARGAAAAAAPRSPLSQHYARQGGSGAVVYRVGETAARSGVRAGDVVSPGSPLPGGAGGDRFVLYALPWNLADASQIRLFAEDDAGNRAEQPFLDLFKPMLPRTDTIEVTDAFLERVVPAIASQTPGFDASGSLLDQYLRINGELRRAELNEVAALATASEPAFLWSGSFLQMSNTALEANFAQTRDYVYNGREVDRQTHLGLDLASTARAPVPAPNAGKVVYAGWMSLYGNAVVIDHGYGLLSLCGHMSAVSAAVGDRVAKGDIIGMSGATGLAGGDHLHLEIFVHGQSVDPLEWLDAKWIGDNLATKLSVPIS